MSFNNRVSVVSSYLSLTPSLLPHSISSLLPHSVSSLIQSPPSFAGSPIFSPQSFFVVLDEVFPPPRDITHITSLPSSKFVFVGRRWTVSSAFFVGSPGELKTKTREARAHRRVGISFAHIIRVLRRFTRRRRRRNLYRFIYLRHLKPALDGSSGEDGSQAKTVHRRRRFTGEVRSSVNLCRSVFVLPQKSRSCFVFSYFNFLRFIWC